MCDQDASVFALVQFFFQCIEEHFIHGWCEVLGADIYRLDDRKVLSELAGGIQHSIRCDAEFKCFFRKTGGNAATGKNHQDFFQICHVNTSPLKRRPRKQKSAASEGRESLYFHYSAEFFYLSDIIHKKDKRNSEEM